MFIKSPTTDLIIVLVIVLLIFGPKRLPGLGTPARSRACASSRTRSPATPRTTRPSRGRSSPRRPRRRRPPRRSAQRESAEVGSQRPRLSGRSGDRSSGEGHPAHRPRRSAEHRRPPRRAAHAPDHLRGGAARRLRRVLLAEPRPARPAQPGAAAQLERDHLSRGSGRSRLRRRKQRDAVPDQSAAADTRPWPRSPGLSPQAQQFYARAGRRRGRPRPPRPSRPPRRPRRSRSRSASASRSPPR